MTENIADLQFHPVTSDRWNDLQSFFVKHGHPNFCWCMRWRLKSTEFKKLNASQRRKKPEELVRTKVPIGILGYSHNKLIAWCSIAPRETYAL